MAVVNDVESPFVSNWIHFFEETRSFLDESERHYSDANIGYTEHTIERLCFCINTCRCLSNYLVENNSTGNSVLNEYQSCLSELTDCLIAIHLQWLEHEHSLESVVMYTSRIIGQSGVRSHRGRPSYEVSRDQVKYLSSLGFKWTEIAAMLGISRMTLYRFVAHYETVYCSCWNAC